MNTRGSPHSIPHTVSIASLSLSAHAVTTSCCVYVLTKKQPDGVYVKVGIAQDPIKRLRGLIQGLPWIPESMHYLRMRSRDSAREIETHLLERCANWRTRGEWHLLSAEQMPAFLKFVTISGEKYARKALSPLWGSLDVSEFLAAAEKARQEKARQGMEMARAGRPKRLSGLGKLSYSDFKKHASEIFSPYKRASY